MGGSSTSSRRPSDTPTHDTAAETEAVQTTLDSEPRPSACDLLRPLSSGSPFPVPNSGSLASLARRQSQQQITPPQISPSRKQSPQSDSGAGATAESFDAESLQRATASARRREAEQSSSPASWTSRLSSQRSDDGLSQHLSPSPYASIFPEGTDTTTPLVLRRCDDQDDDCSTDEPVRKYSESMQLFRRNSEDDKGKTWKRRVVEYR